MENLNKVSWFSRISFFVIFFWFGFLKTIHVSAAEELVNHLFEITISNYVDFRIFYILLGLFECVIGLLWLFPKLTKYALFVYLSHLIMTLLPLLFLINDSWQFFLTPTLVGQYIIKNLAMASLAFYIYYFYVFRVKESQKIRKSE